MAKNPYFGDKKWNNLETHFFFGKSGFVTFLHISKANLMQKIRKIQWWEVWELVLLTDRRTDGRLKEWKLSINALYSSYLPMASNQTIKDRPHQRQWWVGRVSLVSTYLPVLNPGRWKQKNNWPMIPAAVGRVRSTAPNINNTISPKNASVYPSAPSYIQSIPPMT